MCFHSWSTVSNLRRHEKIKHRGVTMAVGIVPEAAAAAAAATASGRAGGGRMSAPALGGGVAGVGIVPPADPTAAHQPSTGQRRRRNKPSQGAVRNGNGVSNSDDGATGGGSHSAPTVAARRDAGNAMGDAGSGLGETPVAGALPASSSQSSGAAASPRRARRRKNRRNVAQGVGELGAAASGSGSGSSGGSGSGSSPSTATPPVAIGRPASGGRAVHVVAFVPVVSGVSASPPTVSGAHRAAVGSGAAVPRPLPTSRQRNGAAASARPPLASADGPLLTAAPAASATPTSAPSGIRRGQAGASAAPAAVSGSPPQEHGDGLLRVGAAKPRRRVPAVPAAAAQPVPSSDGGPDYTSKRSRRGPAVSGDGGGGSGSGSAAPSLSVTPLDGSLAAPSQRRSRRRRGRGGVAPEATAVLGSDQSGSGSASGSGSGSGSGAGGSSSGQDGRQVHGGHRASGGGALVAAPARGNQLEGAPLEDLSALVQHGLPLLDLEGIEQRLV